MNLKTQVLTLLGAFLFLGLASAHAQDLSTLTAPLATPDGEQMNLAEMGTGKVTIVSFGATWCVPCKKEMEAVNELYPEMQEKGVQFISVFIDNTKTMAKVGPFVKSKGFLFPVLLDPNSEIFEVVNGTEVPYTLVYDATGVLRYKHDGFLEGDQEHLMEEALALAEEAVAGTAAGDTDAAE